MLKMAISTAHSMFNQSSDNFLNICGKAIEEASLKGETCVFVECYEISDAIKNKTMATLEKKGFSVSHHNRKHELFIDWNKD